MKAGRATVLTGALVLCATVFPAIVSGGSDGDATQAVALTGVLKTKTEFGPPGFGETPKRDSKVRIFVLKLQEPRTVKELALPDGPKPGEVFSEVQLRCDSSAFPQCETLLKKSVGQRITVSGKTDGQTYPTDYLPVILHVRRVTNQ